MSIVDFGTSTVDFLSTCALDRKKEYLDAYQKTGKTGPVHKGLIKFVVVVVA